MKLNAYILLERAKSSKEDSIPNATNIPIESHLLWVRTLDGTINVPIPDERLELIAQCLNIEVE